MAQRGELKPTDHLRRGESGEWVAASNTKGLVFGSPPHPPAPAPAWPAVPAWPPQSAPQPQYEYKMVQVPPNIEVQEGTSTRGRAAAYLEGIVNQYAEDGWEFFRVDQVGIRIHPGCLSALFGGQSRTVVYYVVTFRRPR
jgi:hypothetical protein